MVKINDFTPNILNQTKQRASIFLRTACDQVTQLSTPNTPMDKGNLRRDIIKSVLGLHGEIEWRKVYAEYQERGSRADGSRKVKNYTTPGTGPHYAENAIKEVSAKTGIIAKLSHLI